MLIDTISLELFNNTEHWKENGQLILHDRFFMLRDFSFARKDFLKSTQPYRLQEGRVVIVKRGSASYSFNLVEHHFSAGDVVVFLADTLVEKKGHSNDFEVDALSFDYDSSWLPPLERGVICLHTDSHSQPIVAQHFSLMWDMAQEAIFPADNVKALLNSLLIFIHRHAGQFSAIPANRSEEILRRFINLVSKQAVRERNIPYYADKLCIASHYLSTLVKQTSGRTAMQWINQMAIKEAKVWLAYSDETIAQIADRMMFTCPASFTKFFKREVGITPTEYRQKSFQSNHPTTLQL